MVVGAVCASEVLVALVHVLLLQVEVELRLTLSVSEVTGGSSVLEASEVETLSALDVVKVVAEYVLVAFKVVELAVDDSIEMLELDRVVVSEADVTTELLLEGWAQTPPLL